MKIKESLLGNLFSTGFSFFWIGIIYKFLDLEINELSFIITGILLMSGAVSIFILALFLNFLEGK